MNSTENNLKISTGLAELYGAMIGDGCLSKYFSKYDQKEKHCILITGHTHDEEYYRKTIRPIFEQEFGIKGCIRFKKTDNVVRFETISKRIFKRFTDMGFPVGLKNNLEIPNRISIDNGLAIACVRGIFDTDGSIYKRYSKKYSGHKRKYDYKNIEIKMKSKKVIEQIKSILNKNDIVTSNIRMNANNYVLNIHKQTAIESFYKLIKPNNPYHKERFLKLP